MCLDILSILSPPGKEEFTSQNASVCRAEWKELEGHQQFSTDCGSKQDIPDTLTILAALNLFEPAPESCPHLQCSAVEENLST